MRFTTLLMIVVLFATYIFSLQNTKNTIDIEDLKAVIKTQSQQIKQLEQKRILKPIEVTVTAYSPREVETDSTPYTTAFLQEVKLGTIAVSRDLFLKGWTPGKHVYIYQIGVFEIADLMSHRKSSHLDVFFFSTEQALEFGVKKSKAILLEI